MLTFSLSKRKGNFPQFLRKSSGHSQSAFNPEKKESLSQALFFLIPVSLLLSGIRLDLLVLFGNQELENTDLNMVGDEGY